jgi:hypothetical protein
MSTSQSPSRSSFLLAIAMAVGYGKSPFAKLTNGNIKPVQRIANLDNTFKLPVNYGIGS